MRENYILYVLKNCLDASWEWLEKVVLYLGKIEVHVDFIVEE